MQFTYLYFYKKLKTKAMKKICIYLLLLVSTTLQAQFNMVPNPSFEDTVFGASCYCENTIELCVKNWFNPQGATPDYYTYFPGYCIGVSSVNNPSGFQLAKTGNAYAGVYGFVSPNRDYIAVNLTDSLQQGVCYYAEFYVSLANKSRYAIDNMGGYFTNDTSGYKLLTTNIPVVPQVLNQAGHFLSDTMTWQKVSGSFTASGGETFLIIGNFFNDVNTILDTVKYNSNWQAAYYYIDDVLVTPCDSLTGIHSNYSLPDIKVYPMPATNFLNVTSNRTIQNCRVKLFDLSGREITQNVTIKSVCNGWQLDLSNLSNGLYILKLTDGLTFGNQFKIIKQLKF
jgi:hypothetical protein